MSAKKKFFYTLLAIGGLFILYLTTSAPNVKVNADKYFLTLRERTLPHILADSLKKKGVISSRLTFRWMSSLMSLKALEPGVYELENQWSNFQIVRYLKNKKIKEYKTIPLISGRQRRLVIKELAQKSGLHEDDIWAALFNKQFLQKTGFSKESVFCIFIPQNYYFEDLKDASQLAERLYQEYLFFWNNKRLKKAKSMGLSPKEVTILSSIVYSESKLNEEIPIIAGVFLNRLEKDMKLESDPTVIYANRIFSANRVLNKHRSVDSPYNTYKRKGLPPGPIYITPSEIIDLVLDFEGHDFLYFCADKNFTGKHLFSETFEEHVEKANLYRKALDQKNIFN